MPDTPLPSEPSLRTADYDYALPEALIAQEPARPRDAARLLVLREEDGASPEDRGVLDLPALLEPGDVMVVNDTRVIPARLRGRRVRAASSPAGEHDGTAGDARLEILLNRCDGGGLWQALVRNARRLRPDDAVAIEGADGLVARVVERGADGTVMLDFGPDPAALAAALDRAGEVPLPPYVTRPGGPGAADREDYQTIFARRPGAVAAPTASLHFTPRLVAALEARGVRRAAVTLHVGAGTFLPLRGEDPRAHRLHAEWGEVTDEAAAVINAARPEGRRIVAVGTTALRLLETAAAAAPEPPDLLRPVRPFRGLTDLFLLPGHRFRAADLLMTNFHLPRSTLLMLACAFAGPVRVRAAYAHAVARGYRFFSYGDASLLWRRDAP